MSDAPRRAGVIGWPVAQSLSPVLHNYWLKEYGLPGEYVALAVREEEFEATVRALPRQGFVGASVTIPHKRAAFQLAATHDADARATGAVNTLVFAGHSIHGRNTDVAGFAASLTEGLGENAARAGPAIVLGAGGAARAILLALTRLGSSEIRVVNRTRSRAEKLAADFHNVVIGEWGDWKDTFANGALLVNATSLGMMGKPPLDVTLDAIAPNAAVVDIVYNPLETGLLSRARARGYATLDGLGMLMHQAVPAFAAWFGVTPRVTPQLRTVLEKTLANG